MPLPAWLGRVRALWRRIFFWQNAGSSPSADSEAHHDHALVLHVTHSRSVPRWQQWRFLHRVLNTRERQLFWGGLLLAVVAGAIGATDLIRPHLGTVPVTGGTLTEALVGTPKLINPLFAPQNDVDRDLVALIYSGLFRLNDKLEAEPDLADSYHWLDDGKTLEITLRKNAHFHDGEPVTADDIVFTYTAAKNPAWRSPLTAQYRDLRVIRVDESTVQFQVDQPNPSLPHELTLGILPAHLWNEVTDANAHLADINLKPVGSGPYQVVSFTRDSKGALLTYRLRLFNQYYAIAPSIEERVFRFYPDRDQAEIALRENQVDALAFVPWTEVASIKSEAVRPVAIRLPQETVAFLNLKDQTLKDDRVRQALSLAVDREELITLVGEHVTRVDGPFPFLSATPTQTNLDEARRLLDAAGWKLKEGEAVRSYVPTPVRGLVATATSTSSTLFTLTIGVPDQTDLLKVADALKRRWSLLGAQVEVRSQDAESLVREAMTTRDVQVLITNVLLQPDQDITTFWRSDMTGDRGLNLANLEDRDVDAALNALSVATTTEAIEAGRRAVSQAILARTPALFLLQPTYAYLVSKTVQGVSDMTLARPADRLTQSRDWYLKTGWRWK